jgi:hypothetical protein
LSVELEPWKLATRTVVTTDTSMTLLMYARRGSGVRFLAMERVTSEAPRPTVSTTTTRMAGVPKS